MSIKRRDLVRYLEQNGFSLLREGGKDTIYSKGVNTVPVKRRRPVDRVTANELCKQAGLHPHF